jgi:D-proline reductase (dithiol) PrdB
MCHQSVGLIQSLLEKEGIPTVSITLLPEVTRKVDPPRALFVDRPLGYPLGAPDNPELQLRIIVAALSLVSENRLPLLATFSEED